MSSAPIDSLSEASSVCLHSGTAHQGGDPLVNALVQSTTFCQAGLGGTVHAYSRVSNPTVLGVETTLGAIENAPPAVCFGSGLAAESALFLALLKAGDHCVCGRAVYGGTTRLLGQLFAGLGVRTTFVDSTDTEAVIAAVEPDTKLVFVETPANPTLDLTDISAIATFTRERKIPLAVDNTFLTGVIQKPLDLGADICVYSTTKFIEGHSAALGGAVVSRDEDLLERVKFIRKCTGGIQAPLNAWLTGQGIKTLPIRLERQCRTATTLAGKLAALEGVSRVYHPSLFEGEQAAIAAKQHEGGLHGAVVTVQLDEAVVDVPLFLKSLKLCKLVEHVGSVETLVTHPASMTHADVPVKQRLEAGITDGLIRISVGLEDAGLVADDLIGALSVSAKNGATIGTGRGAECLTVA